MSAQPMSPSLDIWPHAARLCINLNQKAQHCKMGSSIIRVTTALVVTFFHIGDGIGAHQSIMVGVCGGVVSCFYVKKLRRKLDLVPR